MRIEGAAFGIAAIDSDCSLASPEIATLASASSRHRVSLTPAETVALPWALRPSLGCAFTPAPSGQRRTSVEPIGARMSSLLPSALAKSITSGGMRA